MGDEIASLLEDEWYIVRNSGEIPEIALHSSLYYLTVSEDGPQLRLSDRQVARLRQAAVDRFHEIIVRDLLHANYGTPGYRGIERSITNYRRFCTFCERQSISVSMLKRPAAAALRKFLEIEVSEAGRRERPTIINCSRQDLRSFAAELGVDLDSRFAGLGEICADTECNRSSG